MELMQQRMMDRKLNTELEKEPGETDGKHTSKLTTMANSSVDPR
jgi:hypothetical protein